MEKEALRVTRDGYFSHIPDMFADNPHIVRDFSENQTEINTGISETVEDAVAELQTHTKHIRETLAKLPEPEILWAFSNPPYIRGEDDIPIARYEGADAEKTVYREYLAKHYGRYKMTFSGIHFNYSFSDEALAEIAGRTDIAGNGTGETLDIAAKTQVSDGLKEQIYVNLAARAQEYNWLVVAATAASPLMDSSYFEQGVFDRDVFLGMGSVRCSEMGYWNFFTPILDYANLKVYADTILCNVSKGLIRSSAELYYPVRLKPPGRYSAKRLKTEGVSHIELRMIDLNPFSEAGIDIRDAHFIQLLLVYLAMLPSRELSAKEQVQAIQNTKNAARYDLAHTHILTTNDKTLTIADAALDTIAKMRAFYMEYFGESSGEAKKIRRTLGFQAAKFENEKNRYAYQVRERFTGTFVKKGLQLCLF